MAVYRRVKVIVQNNMNEVLTGAGLALIRGKWTEDKGPSSDLSIESQSTQIWEAESDEVGVGIEAYVRLGSTKGYMKLAWCRPWVGDFASSSELPDGIEVSCQVDGEEPASPAVIFSIYEPETLEEETIIEETVLAGTGE